MSHTRPETKEERRARIMQAIEVTRSYKRRIIERAELLCSIKGLEFDADDFESQLGIANECVTLDYKKFLFFDEFNFMHDVLGIMGNVDIDDESMRGFRPRCAK